MLISENFKKQNEDVNYYECEVIKTTSLIQSSSFSEMQTEKSIQEIRCKLRLYQTYIKFKYQYHITTKTLNLFFLNANQVTDYDAGVEEIFHLNRRSRIEWIWNNNEYKNNINNFIGFILCNSIDPESKQEMDIMSLKGNINGNKGKMNTSEQTQVRNFSLTSLNYDNKNIGSDIENEQNVKIQMICYFTDNKAKQYVIQYFKMRVIQRNFHKVYRAIKKLGKGSFASVIQFQMIQSIIILFSISFQFCYVD